MQVIKRDGREQEFSKDKVYHSVYEACLNAHHDKNTAENIAKKVTNDILKHLKGKKVVKTTDIFKYVSTLLEKYDRDAAFLYETHRDIS